MTGPKGGRPTSLDDVWEPAKVRDDNVIPARTVEDEILRRMANGSHVDTAAGAIGINRYTLHDWLKVGGRAIRDLNKGTRAPHGDPNRTGLPTLSEHEQRLVWFSRAVEATEDRWVERQEELLEKITSGGIIREIVTVKTGPDDNVIETTTRTEPTLPDTRAMTWRLERHRATRKLYKPPIQEISGPDGDPIPIEQRVTGLLDRIRTTRASKEPTDDDT